MRFGGDILNNITNYLDFLEDTVGTGVPLNDPYISLDEYQKFVTDQGLGDIAGKYGIGQCVEAKKAMVEELKKRNEKYEIIEIRYSYRPGVIVSLTLEELYGINDPRTHISVNGYHVGILYNGLVHCNVPPFGLPVAVWPNDFFGQRHLLLSWLSAIY